MHGYFGLSQGYGMSDSQRLLEDPTNASALFGIGRGHYDVELDLRSASATRRDRRYCDLGDGVRAFTVLIKVVLFVYLAILFYSTGDGEDYYIYNKVETWALVWLGVTTMDEAFLFVSSVLSKNGNSIMHNHIVFRLLRNFRVLFIFAWFVYGSKLLWFDKTKQNIALTWARIFWTLEALFFLAPCILISGLCLCLPCIIFLMVRFQVPQNEQRPTPENMLAKMVVKEYSEHADVLQEKLAAGCLGSSSSQQLVDAETSALVGNSSQNLNSADATAVTIRNEDEDQLQRRQTNRVISNLLGKSTAAPAFGITPPAPPGQSFDIQKSCPICFTDYSPADEVMVMPCDPRHFFHVSCVSQWLRHSQVCPICRANVVLLMGNRESVTETITEDSEVIPTTVLP